jgi:hypothetical protein
MLKIATIATAALPLKAVPSRDHGTEIGELEQMLSHGTVRILELENRCTGNRTEGSNP